MQNWQVLVNDIENFRVLRIKCLDNRYDIFLYFVFYKCMPVSITLCGYFCFLRNFSNSSNLFAKVMSSDTIVLILRARQKAMLVLV